MAAKKKSAQRAPRWKDEDGCYLAIFDDHEGLYLAWLVEDGPGGRVGEMGESKLSAEPTDRDRRVAWLIYNAVKPLSFHTGQTGTLYFVTEERASEALRAANFALHQGCVWPAWAIEAQKHGWIAPEGWEP